MPKHSLPQSSNRQAIVVIVAVSSLLALAAIFGPIWVVRVGVLIAVVGAVVAVWFAWRELTAQRRAHRLEMRSQTLRAAEAAERHHVETMEVIDRFSTRHHALTERFQVAQRQLEQAKVELASVKGTLIATQLESRQRATRISQLEAEVAAHTAELAELAEAQEQAAREVSAALEKAQAQADIDEAAQADVGGAARAELGKAAAAGDRDEHDGSDEMAEGDETGDVVALPRYGTASKRAELPTARELWAQGNEPEVVNIGRVSFPVARQKQA